MLPPFPAGELPPRPDWIQNGRPTVSNPDPKNGMGTRGQPFAFEATSEKKISCPLPRVKKNNQSKGSRQQKIMKIGADGGKRKLQGHGGREKMVGATGIEPMTSTVSS
jgi:hypothetical protein